MPVWRGGDGEGRGAERQPDRGMEVCRRPGRGGAGGAGVAGAAAGRVWLWAHAALRRHGGGAGAG